MTACAAGELFASPLFEGRRRYAVTSGLPWYILSAKFGLLAPEDVIGPYDVYLADQNAAYRKAWGEFVTAQLEQLYPALLGGVIEVHAGAAYVEPLRAPLAAKGVTVVTPLGHLRQGEQVAWYQARVRAPGKASRHAHDSAEPVPARVELGDQVAELVRELSDQARGLSPHEFFARGPNGLRVPGLYSWWADERGAADLSHGLGLPVGAGLIYAGQAGATKWPSGKRSSGTLWDRITGMHLGTAAEFSTFRRTLAAILSSLLGMTSEDDPQLSAWIKAHLRVIAVPVPDAHQLSQVEAAVLDSIDPPLNLQGRAPSPVRARLTELRRQRDSGRPADPSCLPLRAAGDLPG